MTIPFLTDLAIILSLSLVVVLLLHGARLPMILGFLLTGVLAGPHGFGLIQGVHEVEILAEVGVILLLFTIGIEFSLRSLIRIWRGVILGGALQVTLTGLVIYLLARGFGQTIQTAVFMGLLVSLSSTAIVLKILQERAELDAPHGRTALAILIFQDMAVVPMMLFTPLLALEGGNLAGPLLTLMGRGIGIVVLVVLAARWVVPWILLQAARTQSRELFLLRTLATGLAAAWLTSWAGLSLALGAFLAGLVISESEYSAQALGEIIPFKDLFISFFFVSIGMLLDISFLFGAPLLVAATAILVLGVKAGVAGAVAVVLRFPLRTALLGGLALSQVGEFSFILSRVGLEHGLLPGDHYQLFLSVSVVTMAVTPFLIAGAPALADAALRLPLPRWLAQGRGEETDLPRGEYVEVLSDHLIVVGYGVNGRNLARAARVAGIPYAIVEANPEVARRERRAGEPILFGDATHPAVLERVSVARARILVMAISDPSSTRRITSVARRLSPGLRIVARTRYVEEMGPLYAYGANDVIPEEFETSVEIVTRVLRTYLIPRYEIELFIAEIRARGYEMFRNLAMEGQSTEDIQLRFPDSEVATVRVWERSYLVGRSLRDVALRTEYGVTLLAIQREGKTLTNPAADTVLHEGDILIAFGRPEQVAAAAALARGTDVWGPEGDAAPR